MFSRVSLFRGRHWCVGMALACAPRAASDLHYPLATPSRVGASGSVGGGDGDAVRVFLIEPIAGVSSRYHDRIRTHTSKSAHRLTAALRGLVDKRRLINLSLERVTVWRQMTTDHWHCVDCYRTDYCRGHYRRLLALSAICSSDQSYCSSPHASDRTA